MYLSRARLIQGSEITRSISQVNKSTFKRSNVIQYSSLQEEAKETDCAKCNHCCALVLSVGGEINAIPAGRTRKSKAAVIVSHAIVSGEQRENEEWLPPSSY
jgi:hypothetical protein